MKRSMLLVGTGLASIVLLTISAMTGYNLFVEINNALKTEMNLSEILTLAIMGLSFLLFFITFILNICSVSSWNNENKFSKKRTLIVSSIAFSFVCLIIVAMGIYNPESANKLASKSTILFSVVEIALLLLSCIFEIVGYKKKIDKNNSYGYEQLKNANNLQNDFYNNQTLNSAKQTELYEQTTNSEVETTNNDAVMQETNDASSKVEEVVEETYQQEEPKKPTFKPIQQGTYANSELGLQLRKLEVLRATNKISENDYLILRKKIIEKGL